MLEQSTKRIAFKSGIQKKFIVEAREKISLTRQELSQRLLVHPRTLADWTREKFTMPLEAAGRLSSLSNVSIPKPHQIIDWKEHLRAAGKMSGTKRFLKYGTVAPDETYRKRRWREWWETVGKYKDTPAGFQSLLTITIPKKDVRLAEFVGIMLGDGGIRPYHIHITLSNKEKEYTAYVIDLLTELFGVVPKLYTLKASEAVDIVVQRKQLVDFCQEVGLVKGNKVKQQITIPSWILGNKAFAHACVRGLIDTDGCFFTSSYSVGGKKYSYLKIAFTSASVPLVESVYSILRNAGIGSRITKNYKEVRIENQEHVHKYIDLIGSQNKKHLEKIEKRRRLSVIKNVVQ